jgi:hypothetical protein
MISNIILFSYAAGIAIYAAILANKPSIIMGPVGPTPQDAVQYKWDIINHFGTNVVASSYAVMILVPSVMLVNYGYNVVMKKMALQQKAVLVAPVTSPTPPGDGCVLATLKDVPSVSPVAQDSLMTTASVAEQLVSCSSFELSMDVLIFLSQFPC